MDRTSVDSSNIQSIGYDVDIQVLEVEFNNGSLYHYFNVPENVYQELMSAGSHGSYLASAVKGTYNYERVG